MPKRHEPPIGAVVTARALARGEAARERRSAAKPPPPAPRLSYFAELAVPIRVECDACRRKVDRPAEHWLALFGDVTLKAVEQRARCTACGERDLIDARPLYERKGRAGEPGAS
ncbi:MAG: hypothetical protein MI723_12425 [Caulobacterales bacterium]|nr:hypothetical protein [Caulobacterales bacterium]